MENKKFNPDAETLREAVRVRYRDIVVGKTTLIEGNQSAEKSRACCESKGESPAKQSGCCSTVKAQAQTLGYSAEDLAQVPAEANLGLGCGNPVAIAALQPGETVVDLGAGAGFDAFLAAKKVGESGRVIGVDMVPEMVAKARANLRSAGVKNIEFRLGEIEALPAADSCADVIISNCVINLCPDKRPVYREAFRVLKPGGRLAVSDVVAREKLSDDVMRDLALHSGCLSGATLLADLEKILRDAGFTEITIRPRANSDAVISSWEAKRGFEEKVFAAEVSAKKPNCRCGC